MAHQCECETYDRTYEVHRDEHGSYLACGDCGGENPVPKAAYDAGVPIPVTNLVPYRRHLEIEYPEIAEEVGRILDEIDAEETS